MTVPEIVHHKDPNRLFEQSFQAGWDYWVREFNPSTKQSTIRKLPNQWEYFQPGDGKFHSLYKPEIKYQRMLGPAKVARSKIQATSPADLVIRDEYQGIGRYNPNPRIMYLDIETRVGTVMPGFPVPEKALEPISLFQFLDNYTNTVHIIGDKEWGGESWYRQQKDHKDYDIKFHQCRTEIEMFELFFSFIEKLKPAVVYAWNGEGFDFPYLYNRAQRLGLDTNKFSPWRVFGADVVKLKENVISDKYVANIEAAGIYYIDLLRLYKKIVLAPRKSYSLNAIATQELKTRKIDHSEFPSFEDFYHGNYKKPNNPTEDQKKTLCWLLTEKNAPYELIQQAGYGQFVYYGVIDTVLIKGIDEKVGLSKLMVQMTEDTQSQFVDVLGTTKPWGNAIRNRLFQDGAVINALHIDADLDKTISGGFVRDPERGKQRAVMSADVNSMYPILAIAGFNMSPETFKFAYQIGEKLPELKDFAIQELKVGTLEEQNEQNMLNIMEDPDKKAKLMALLEMANVSMAPNGVFFDKTKEGIVPTMVKEIYKKRKAEKKDMIKADQLLKLVEAEIKERKNAGFAK